MSYDWLKRKLSDLSKQVPGQIVLTLDDDRQFACEAKDPLDFFFAGMDAIRKGSGELFHALRHCVGGTNCGHLWQVLAVMAAGPVGNTPPARPPPQKIVTQA